MTKKIRRFIFYTFLALFIILAFIIILYAQGYSFDWQEKSLVITGAFYFKSYPKEAEIYINNDFKGKTNKFVKRLLPKEYDIKISKLGYYDWQKTLQVESKLVTEAKNILLTKKNPLINQVLPAGRQGTNYNVKQLSISNDRKKIIYLTDRAVKEINPTQQKIADPREIPTYSKFALRLLDLTKNTDIQINSSIPNLKNLSGISWSSDNKKLLLSLPYGQYYILDLSIQGWSASGRENPLKIIDFNNLIKIASNYKIYRIEKSLFHFQDPNKVYFLFNNNLFLADLTNVSPPISLSPNILTYSLTENKILYIQLTDHFLYKMNLDGSNKQKIAEIPKNTQEIQLSDDNKKILWRTKNEIGVIWLEEKEYETEIIIKTSNEISQVIWHLKTNQHVIFVVGNEVKITELDGRDKRNTVDIISIDNPSVYLNKWNKKLYILSKEQLFEIE